jgi:hypothetical protein
LPGSFGIGELERETGHLRESVKRRRFKGVRDADCQKVSCYHDVFFES